MTKEEKIKKIESFTRMYEATMTVLKETVRTEKMLICKYELDKIIEEIRKL